MSDDAGLIKLLSHAGRGAVILVSGARQVGKTTVLLGVRAAAIHAGRSVGGFLSVARFDPVTHAKTGIDLMDASTGARQTLAIVGGAGPVQTGHYTFDPAAMEAGLCYAEAGQGADVFFVDELGPLELKQGKGWVPIIDMIRARAFGVALVTMRPDLLDRAREHMNLPPDSPVIVITAANRDAMAAQVAAWLTEP